MLKAFEAYRSGNYAETITKAGAAFESVLKTICTVRKWPHNPDKDTLTPLVNACKDGNLFPGFYVPVMTATGTIRNKLADAHGRGPEVLYPATKDYADHMLQLVSTHINLLVKLAELPA